MKIGTVVYSQTGNTLSVANKIQEKLSTTGHSVAMERLEISAKPENDLDIKGYEFKDLPSMQSYEGIIFCAPVQAFNLCPMMKAYFMKSEESLKAKKVALLTTQAFPYAWLGGNRAIKYMRKQCEARGAEVLGSGIVNWMRKSRDQQIKEVVEKIADLF